MARTITTLDGRVWECEEVGQDCMVGVVPPVTPLPTHAYLECGSNEDVVFVLAPLPWEELDEDEIAELIEEGLPPSLPPEIDPSLTLHRIFGDDEGRKVLAWTDVRVMGVALLMNFKVGRRRYRLPLDRLVPDNPGRHLIQNATDQELQTWLGRAALIEGVER